MWFKYLLIGLMTLGTLLKLPKINKTIPPIEGVLDFVITGFLVWGILTYWGAC